MAEKQSKKKSKASAREESGVLASLPATRPARISGRARSSDTEAAAAAPRASTKATSTKAAPAKPKAKRTPAKRTPAKPAATKPKTPTAATPKAEPASVTTAKPARPRPVRSASRNLAEPAKKAADKRPAEDRSPSGTELVTTVVQAAGELAQVGLTVGGQILKRAVEKLPKP